MSTRNKKIKWNQEAWFTYRTRKSFDKETRYLKQRNIDNQTKKKTKHKSVSHIMLYPIKNLNSNWMYKCVQYVGNCITSCRHYRVCRNKDSVLWLQRKVEEEYRQLGFFFWRLTFTLCFYLLQGCAVQCALGYNNLDFFENIISPDPLMAEKWILRHICKTHFSFFCAVSCAFGLKVCKKC